MKQGLVNPFLIVLFPLAILACGDSEREIHTSQNIEAAIRKYFGEDEEYLYKKKIDFNVPNIVRAAASMRPDLGVATFDVYWVGKTLDAKRVNLISGDDILGSFDIENFERGTIDDPLVEEYTGHGMFLVPISEFKKFIKNSNAAFQMVAAEGIPVGEMFVCDEVAASEHRVFHFKRLK